MPVCKKCGKEYDDTLNACPFCGEPLTPDLPDEDFDMYQELQSSSDTKEFVLPDVIEEVLEEASATAPAPEIPKRPVLDDDAPFQTSSILIADVREKLVQEMYNAEPEEPTLLEKMKSSVDLDKIKAGVSAEKIKSSSALDRIKASASSFFSSLKRPRKAAEPEEENTEAEDTPEAISETAVPDTEDTAPEEETAEPAEAAEEDEAPEIPEDTADEPSVSEDTEPDDFPGVTQLFDELRDEPYEEDPEAAEDTAAEVPAETETEKTDAPAEETSDESPEEAEDVSEEEPDDRQKALDTILLSLRERVDKKQSPSADEPETAAEETPEEETAEEEPSSDEETDSVPEEEPEGKETEEKPAVDGSKLLKKKGLGKVWVLGLAIAAILAVLGVIFFWIVPQKQAEQQAIEDRENAYLDFLCDTWMSDVFIYAEEEHPSREVLTLNRDMTYRCDIWTSSSDREAFDPEIWSITDTNEGTYYLELDTASLRIYYTGEDGEDYVYRRYIRDLNEDTLVLREYYNETLSEYYDVSFTKYQEG